MKFLMKSICGLTAALCLNACSTTDSQIQYKPNTNKPAVSKNSLHSMQQCFISKLRSPMVRKNNIGYIVGVENVADGTIPFNSTTPNALADSGRLQMLKSLFNLMIKPNPDSNHTILLHKVPFMFRQDISPLNIHNQVADVFGYVNQNYFVDYKKDLLTRFFNNSTKQKSPLYHRKDAVQPLLINAAFSRYDTEGALSGYGSDTEYDKNTDLKLAKGKKKVQRYMGLTINVIDPATNMVLQAENFELALSQNDNTTTIKVGRKDFIGSGVTINKQSINSPHEAQQILIDYAAMWFVKNLYRNDFSSCGNI